MATAGAWCVAAGVTLVWGLTRPEVMPGVRTGELAVVLGLLVLPVLTLASLWGERRARQRRR